MYYRLTPQGLIVFSHMCGRSAFNETSFGMKRIIDVHLGSDCCGGTRLSLHFLQHIYGLKLSKLSYARLLNQVHYLVDRNIDG